MSRPSIGHKNSDGRGVEMGCWWLLSRKSRERGRREAWPVSSVQDSLGRCPPSQLGEAVLLSKIGLAAPILRRRPNCPWNAPATTTGPDVKTPVTYSPLLLVLVLLVLLPTAGWTVTRAS